ncbi:hypothetical protein N9260_01990 [bacterium]|nr:hypothetical protein [bacterium]
MSVPIGEAGVPENVCPEYGVVIRGPIYEPIESGIDSVAGMS